jgi:hypothetical protein
MMMVMMMMMMMMMMMTDLRNQTPHGPLAPHQLSAPEPRHHRQGRASSFHSLAGRSMPSPVATRWSFCSGSAEIRKLATSH